MAARQEIVVRRDAGCLKLGYALRNGLGLWLAVGAELLERRIVRANGHDVHRFGYPVACARDVALAAESVGNLSDYIYRQLPLALLEVIGTRLLDNLLADKDVVSNVVQSQSQSQSQSRLAGVGVSLIAVGVRDIVLRAHMIQSDGSVRDTAVFSILQSEWLAVKNGLVQRLKRTSR